MLDATVQFRMTLSDLECLSKISNDICGLYVTADLV